MKIERTHTKANHNHKPDKIQTKIQSFIIYQLFKTKTL